MTAVSILSLLPGGLVTLILIALMLWAVVVYALRTKGDVRVLLTRGKTTFELEAKERNSKR